MAVGAAMEIGLAFTGFGTGDKLFLGLAQSMDAASAAYDKLLAKGANLAALGPKMDETTVRRYERLAVAAQKMASSNNSPTAGSAPSVAAAAPQVVTAATTTAVTAAAATPPPTVSSAAAAQGPSPSTATSFSGKFFKGPAQQLQEIQRQIVEATKMPAGEVRDAILKDLEHKEFRLKRSLVLGDRRVAQGDKALNAPGLLDLFQELNGLMKSLTSGNPIAAVKAIGRGIELWKEMPGGKNVEQKMASAVTATGQGHGLGGWKPLQQTSQPAASGSESEAQQLLMDNISKAWGGGRVGQAAGKAAQWATGGTKAAANTAAGTGAGSAASAGSGAAGAAAIGSKLVAMLANPVGVFIAAVLVGVAGIALMVKAAEAAAEVFNRFTEAERASGGTAENVAFLRAAGMDPGQVAGAAGSLRQGMATDPTMMAAASRLGMGPVSERRFGGQTNEAAILEDAVRRISELSTAEERLQAARDMNMESLLGAIEVYRVHGAQIERDKNMMAGMRSEGDKAGAANVSYEFDRVGQAWDALIGAIGEPGMEIAAQLAGSLADGMMSLAQWIDVANDPLTDLLNSGAGVIGFFRMVNEHVNAMVTTGLHLKNALMQPWKAGDHLKKARDSATAPLRNAANQADKDRATRENTDATRENTRMMKEGQHGGGERVRDATPAGLRGEGLRQQMKQQEIVLGSFR